MARASPRGQGAAGLGEAPPGDAGFAFELATPKKHNIWKKPLCTWYSGFFHCEKLGVPGRRKHRAEDFRRRVPMGRRSAAPDLVQGLPQNPVPPFPLHQLFGPFRSFNPLNLVQGFPQALVLPFLLHQVFGLFRSFPVSDLVQGLPQALVLPFPLHQGPSSR